MPYTVLALNSTTLCKMDHTLALPIAKQNGLQAVELSAGKGPRALIRPEMTEAVIGEWKRRLASHGLQALSLCGHRDLSQPEELAAFEKLMKHAKALGCRFITTAVPDGCSEERFAEGLHHACQQADGLRILLETHGLEHGTGRSLLPFMQVSPACGICYDTGNVLFYGGISPADDLPLCIEHVSHLHLKDKAGELREWNFPPLGSGTVDFASLFALDGWQSGLTASIEVEFTPEGASEHATREAVAQSVRFLRAL